MDNSKKFYACFALFVLMVISTIVVAVSHGASDLVIAPLAGVIMSGVAMGLTARDTE